MTELAKARLNDDQTIAALAQLEAEHGSKAAAIRHAIRQAANADEDEHEAVNAHLRPELRKAHRVVWDLAHDGAVNMDAALAVLAQKMQVSKDICKAMYVRPLAKEDMVRIDSGWSTTTLFVRDPEDTVEVTDASSTDPRHDIDDVEDAADQIDEISDTSHRVATDGGRP